MAASSMHGGAPPRGTLQCNSLAHRFSSRSNCPLMPATLRRPGPPPPVCLPTGRIHLQPNSLASAQQRLRNGTLTKAAAVSCLTGSSSRLPAEPLHGPPPACPRSPTPEGRAGAAAQSRGAACRAAADAAAGGSDQQPAGSGLAVLSLGALFVGWYGANIYFNIFNKTLLKSFAHPLTITNVQFLIGIGLSLIFWATGVVRRPQLDARTISSVYPLAIIHVLGNVLTNVSLGKVAVSFTHTVKAMEPFFSVIMSAIFLGSVPPVPVLLTLLPIVGGVLLASLTETTFNWTGFLAAMFSNITFQSRNVLSKKFMISKGALDNMNLFQIITIMAFFMLLPVTLLLEGAPLLPGALADAGFSPEQQADLARRLLSAGVCFHGYQQLSYMILSRVTPVTHSIGNCVKRVVVIVASVVAFQNPMSTQNAFGTGLALFGVFLYSQAKRRYKDKDSPKPATS